MDFQIRISKAALADLEEVLGYSWTNFPDSAERFGQAILNHVELLRRFPYLGWPVAEHSDVRQLIHTPIAIYYRVDEARRAVDVLHFWHSARRPPAF